MVLRIASLYFILLAFGCLAPLPLVKLREIGVGFYRFFGFSCVGLAALGLGLYLWSGDSQYPALYPIALTAFLAATLLFSLALRARHAWLVWGTFAMAVLFGFLAVVLPWEKYYIPPHWPITGTEEKYGWFSIGNFMFHSLVSSMVMGFVTLAMMLGHWYLVTPKLSIAPLKRFAGGYILLTLLVALELSLAYTVYFGLPWGTGWPSWASPRYVLGEELKKEMIFILFRVTWGVVAPLGFSYWIWQTVKMKSTQSATGILYAAMVCTLVGEGIGLYLTLQTGVPF